MQGCSASTVSIEIAGQPRSSGRIERNGVLIDSSLPGDAEPAAGRTHDHARSTKLSRLAGQPFNLGSPKQIGAVLFTKLGLPVKKKTASGVPSTDEEVLAASSRPITRCRRKLLEHRSLSKLKGTYTDKLPLMVNPANRARPHQLCAGRCGDRPPVEQRPESAEHSDPHR